MTCAGDDTGRIVLGLPSKGRLQADCISWFAGRGIVVRRSESDREYRAEVEGLDGLDIAMLSAGEVPGALTDGRLHLGVTGRDLIEERIPGWSRVVDLAAPMGFGHADLIVAVPDFWADVATMHDLDLAAAAFRRTHGRALRVATKYHRLARRFFQDNGVADYRIIDSQGATEAAPANGTAEVIVDITSSGETLRANHLRVLDDGEILKSEATLCVSYRARWSGQRRAVLDALGQRLGLTLDAGATI